MLCYKIKNWVSGFETSDSLKYKKFEKVMVSNHTSSPEYKRIMRSPNKDTVIAGWLAIIQAASDMPQRGVLCRRNGPLDVEDVADWMLQTPETIEAAFIALTDPRIAWIEVVECPKTLKRSGTGVRMIKDPETGEKHRQAAEAIPVEFPSFDKRIVCHPDYRIPPTQTLILEEISNDVRGISNDVRDISNDAGQIRTKLSKDKLSKGKLRKDNIITASSEAAKNNSIETYVTKSGKSLEGDKLARFLQFWDAFDFKKHKTEAAEEWVTLNGTTEKDFDLIVAAAMQEAKGRRDLIKRNQNPREAANWLKARTWEDEIYQASGFKVVNDWPEGAQDFLRKHWDVYQNYPEKAEEKLKGAWSAFQYKAEYFQLKKQATF
jgi:hypothetical protein